MRRLGAAYRLPAEWEHQSGIQLTWPHADTDWRPQLDAVVGVFAKIGAAISRREKLLSVCQSVTQAGAIKQQLLAAGACADRLCFAFAPSNDTWARDHGPLTVIDGDRTRLVDYEFNGWGRKFPAVLDSAITGNLFAQRAYGETELLRTGIVLEGGAIETDGEGTLLATRDSIIAESRNPGLSQRDTERLLGEQLGLSRFLWLESGRITGDDTDGHIDMLARFVDRNTIVYATAPEGDPDHLPLLAMRDELGALRTRSDRPYRLVPLPFPGVHRDEDDRRLPASYANFLIINGAVLVPIYGTARDREALRLFETLFEAREIVPVDCSRLVRQNGSLHCLAMHLPAPLDLRSARKIEVAVRRRDTPPFSVALSD